MGESSLTFEVEQANCSSCAARVRNALEPLGRVDAVEVGTDSAIVRLSSGRTLSEETVNEALGTVSHGSGHAYRVKPGSWRSEPEPAPPLG